MGRRNIVEQLKQKEDTSKLVNQVIKNPEQIEILVNTIQNEKGSIKFGCEKILRLISEKSPELIYPYFDFFANLLDIDNNFLKWGAIITISNLISVDIENKFEKIFEKYYKPVTGPVMVSAANIIGNSWKIIQSKPHLTGKIINRILKSEKAEYYHKGELSPECKKIVCGSAIDTFEKIFDQIKNKKQVILFVKNQLKNSRLKVRKKAEKFLAKI